MSNDTKTTKTEKEWRETLSPFRGVWAPVLSPAEVHDHEQVAANGYLPELTSHNGVAFRLPAPPVQFDSQPATPQGPAPEIGQHTEELLLELSYSWESIAELRASGALG